jgi:guanylate kinase
MTFAKEFDRIVVNDDLEQAKQDALAVISSFLEV